MSTVMSTVMLCMMTTMMRKSFKAENNQLRLELERVRSGAVVQVARVAMMMTVHRQ
jgi:hypothetical protein